MFVDYLKMVLTMLYLRSIKKLSPRYTRRPYKHKLLPGNIERCQWVEQVFAGLRHDLT